MFKLKKIYKVFLNLKGLKKNKNNKKNSMIGSAALIGNIWGNLLFLFSLFSQIALSFFFFVYI